MHDLRLALRQLLKSPGFTVVAVLALALGIGANAAIFSVVHGVLLRPLPFPEQERLVFLGEWSEQVPEMSVSYPNFVDFRDRQTSFTAFGAARGQGYNYVGSSATERLTGVMASAELFPVLGVPPLLGRVYSAEDDKPGAARTVVLGEPLWRRLFGARDSILGEQINLSGELYTVIGVMPAAFQYPSATSQLWVPLGLAADQYQDRNNHPGLYGVGRLKPGVTFENAVADLKTIAAQLAQEYPTSNAGQSVAMEPLTERAFGTARRALLVLLAAAGCVLLIACANVANLQLARAHGRAREFALRAALGAGRARIIRQLLVESLLLGLIGCGAGLLLGHWGLDALKAVLPANLPRIDEVALDRSVLLFALGLSLATSVIFGLLPALQAARTDLRDALSTGARESAGRGRRWRAALIVGEFALTSILLVGAGLMIRTITNLYRADTGYTTSGLVSFNWVLPSTAYPDEESRRQQIDRALERLATVPGVQAVSVCTPLPLSGDGNQNGYVIEERPDPPSGQVPFSERFRVDPNFFQTLGIRLIAGRSFGPDDRAGSPRVAIVDTDFVAKNFPPGTDVIGKRFAWGGRPADAAGWMQIVGVVEHIQNFGLGRYTREQAYVPYAQSTPAGLSFIVRTNTAPAALMPSLRATMREIAPELPIFGGTTMDELLDRSVGTQRLTVMLLGTFGLLALLLASVGLYGVLNYTVGQRTREIGVRMALGALPGAVVSLVLSQGARLAGLGLALGLVASLGLGRLLQAVLYEVEPFDPASFAAVAAILIVVGLLACWLPARRATRINPNEALRAE